MLDLIEKTGRNGIRFPTVAVGAYHPLADPERANDATEKDAARALFARMDQSLRTDPVGASRIWQDLKTQATAVRMDQSVAPPIQPPKGLRLGEGRVAPLMVDAAIRRSMLEARVDETLPEGRRAEAKDALHRAAVAKGFDPLAVTGDTVLGNPATSAIWNGPTGLEYRASLSRIAIETRDRESYDAVVAATPAPAGPSNARWTNEYGVVAKTPLETAVVRAFMEIALEAVDAGRDPTRAEMDERLAATRRDFAGTKADTRTALAESVAPDADGRTENRFARPITYVETVRPALLDERDATPTAMATANADRAGRDTARLREIGTAHRWRFSSKGDEADRTGEIRANAARIAVTELVADPNHAGRVLDGNGTLGDAIAAAARGDAAPAAQELFAATRDRVAYANAVNVGMARAEAAAARGQTMITDPRDPLAADGAVAGFSSPSARMAPAGSRIAIVGGEGTPSTAEADQIDAMIRALAERYGRDDAGRARMRVTTTLAPGVGEAVMAAGLRHNVPVEAIAHQDLATLDATRDGGRLTALARDLERAGLGGSWTLHKAGSADRGVPNEPSSRAHALRAAMATSDAVIAGRLGKDDVAVPLAATAGRTKPLFALQPTGPDHGAWTGTTALATPDTKITLALERDAGTGRWRDRVIVGGEVRVANEHAIGATADTGAGAMVLLRSADMEIVARAARREIDATTQRERLAEQRQPTAATGIRYGVMASIDYDRLGEREYVAGLGLTAMETKAASLLRDSMLAREGIEGVTNGTRLESNGGELASLLRNENHRTREAAATRPKPQKQAGGIGAER